MKSHFKNQEGVAVLFAILIAGFLVSMVLALSAIFIPKIRTALDIKNSSAAAYAADSAAERCLYIKFKNNNYNTALTMANGAQTTVQGNCTSSPVTVTGTYQGVSRAFEVDF